MQEETIAPVIMHRATIRSMAKSKAIPRDIVERVGEILREIVEKDFGGNETRAGKQLGLSQAQVNDLCNLKPGKGVGLGTLLALRRYTKRGLDDLCGFHPDPLHDQIIARLQASIERAVARGIEQHDAKTAEHPAVPKKSKKGWTEMQEVKYRAAAQGVRDEEAKAKSMRAHKPGSKRAAG